VRRAAIGIAVANADPGVLHVADLVVASNDADGVAEAIEHILAGTSDGCGAGPQSTIESTPPA
jgi:hypothetical protein